MLQESPNYLPYVFAILAAILIFGIVFFLPPVVFESRLASRARKSYQRARGTQHLQQIRASLEILNAKLGQHEEEHKDLANNLHVLAEERNHILVRTLCTHIVQTQLTEVDGIGPTLRDRIIDYCFDGTLISLRRAGQVHGVGTQKQWAIENWLRQKQREIRLLLKNDFPNKTRINNEYDQKEAAIKEKLKNSEEEINAMRLLKSEALAEEQRLGQVTIAHFRKAFKQDTTASENVAAYLQGSFAEWERMPSWFESLVSKYGG